MKHVIAAIALGFTIIGVLVFAGKGEFDAGTFLYDPNDARPAKPTTTAP
jgi:hypothetical protein